MDSPVRGTAPPHARAPGARLAALSIRYRYLVCLGALVLSALCAIPALDLIRLHVKTNIFSLLPADHPSVRNLTALIDKTNGWGDLMVVIDSPDPAANVRYAEALQASLADLRWINYSECRIDTGFLEANALLLISAADLRTIEQRLRDRFDYEVSRRDPMYVDLLEEGPPPVDFADIEARYRRSALLRAYHASPDGRTLVLAIYPAGLSGEVRESRGYLRELQAKVAAIGRPDVPGDLKVRIGGTFVDRLEEYDSIVRDLAVSAAIMAALFVALLLWHFRQAWTVPLVFLTFGMPLLWTFALTKLVVAELNLITVFLVNVLSGLGIDFAIHVLTRYLEERSRGRSLHEALAIVNSRTARACWSAAMTTAVAFWVLLATRFLGFRQFGIIAGFGLTFAFLCAHLVLPSLIAIAEDYRLLQSVQARDLPFPLRIRPSRALFAAAGIAAVLGVAGATQLEFEHDLSRLKTRLPAASRERRETIDAIFGGLRAPIVVVAADLEETAEIEQVLRDQIRQAGGSSSMDAVFSVLDLVPPDQTERLATIGRIRGLVDQFDEFAPPPEKAQIARFRGLLVDRPVTMADLPENLRRRFFGAPGSPGNLVYVLHHVPLADTRRAAALVREVRTIRGKTRTWQATSEAIVVDDLLQIMKEDSVRAVTLSALAVLLVLWIDFKSLRRALTAAIPLVAGVCWMLAAMWLAGLRANFYNMVVFPAILGIGVDSGIHIYHRFLESPGEPIGQVRRATLGAVAASALTTMISFGSLIASVHQGLASLGLLAVLGLTCTLLAATVAFPAFLDRYRSFCS